MEWIVNVNKKRVKHMFANKTEKNIHRKSAALSGIQHIAVNYDKVSDTVVRSKKHSERSVREDELTILETVHQVNPFKYQPGRHYQKFQNIKPSMLEHFDGHKFRSWCLKKISTFSP